jgi:hypothetical protein
MRWCKEVTEGTIVDGGNGEGKESKQFNSPISFGFASQGNLDVSRFWNNRILKFEIEIS